MSEEEKKAIEYYQDREVSFTIENFDWKEFKKVLGITEEDSFENEAIRIKTLLNLIEKQDKMIDKAIKEIEKLRQYFDESSQADFIRILEILKDKNVIDW